MTYKQHLMTTASSRVLLIGMMATKTSGRAAYIRKAIEAAMTTCLWLPKMVKP